MRAERPQPLPDAAIDAARAIRRGLLTSEALTRACIAATICSDSARLTLGSFSPWPIRIGIVIASTRDSGERDHRKSGSSPTRLCHNWIIGFQYSGNDAIRVFRLDGPTAETAHANTSGVSVRPVSVA